MGNVRSKDHSQAINSLAQTYSLILKVSRLNPVIMAMVLTSVNANLVCVYLAPSVWTIYIFFLLGELDVFEERLQSRINFSVKGVYYACVCVSLNTYERSWLLHTHTNAHMHKLKQLLWKSWEETENESNLLNLCFMSE